MYTIPLYVLEHLIHQLEGRLDTEESGCVCGEGLEDRLG